jgi:hypothetical protein
MRQPPTATPVWASTYDARPNVLIDLDALPLPSDSVDLVVCSLAPTHVANLDKTIRGVRARVAQRWPRRSAEYSSLVVALGGVVEMQLPSGRLVRLPASLFLPTDYITAGLHAGFSTPALTVLELTKP